MSSPHNEPLEIETPEEDRLKETHHRETHWEEDHQEGIHHEEVCRSEGTRTMIVKGIESTPEKLAVTLTSLMEIELRPRNSKWNSASLG